MGASSIRIRIQIEKILKSTFPSKNNIDALSLVIQIGIEKMFNFCLSFEHNMSASTI